MHGRNRSEYKAMQRDPKTAASLAKKAQQWHTLTAQILQQPNSNNNDNNHLDATTILSLTEKLLTVNPDPLYLWNQRRKVILSSTSEKNYFSWATESHVTAVSLQNNPKAYGAWFHRKWCLWLLLSSSSQSSSSSSSIQHIFKGELDLTVQFLQRDERNFHCWNFRRFVIGLLLKLQEENDETNHLENKNTEAGAWKILLHNENEKDGEDSPLLVMGSQIASTTPMVPIEAAGFSEPKETIDSTPTIDWPEHEWEFTKQKIQQNFSNFSAFHYRSKLYDIMAKKNKAAFLLTQELELVENAVFTEPDDQTAWWYQSFLLSVSFLDNSKEDTKKEQEYSCWNSHVDNLRELREEVPRSKWVVLGLFNCLNKLYALGKEDAIVSKTVSKEDLVELCRVLTTLDPDRAGRYKSLQNQL